MIIGTLLPTMVPEQSRCPSIRVHEESKPLTAWTKVDFKNPYKIQVEDSRSQVAWLSNMYNT